LENHLGKIKILAVLFILLGGLLMAPSFMSFNNKKQTIENNLHKFTGLDFKIHGDVKVGLLPLPKITLGNVGIKDDDKTSMHLNSLILYPSLSSLFSSRIEIKKIGIHEGELDFVQIKQLLGKSSINNEGGSFLPNFEFVKTSISNLPKGPHSQIKDLTGSLSLTRHSALDIIVVSKFKYGLSQISFNANFLGIDELGSSDSATIEMSDEVMKLNIKGSIDKLYSAPKLEGVAQVNMQELIPESQLTYHLLKKDGFKASGDIKMDDALLDIQNITITSNSISNATGNFEWIYGYEQELDAKFLVESIDLDKLFEGSVDAVESAFDLETTLEEFIRPLINKFDIGIKSRIFGGAILSVKEAVYKSQNIKDINADLDFYNGNLVINKIGFDAPGGTKFHLAGSMSFNEIRPKFEGQTTFEVEKLKEFSGWLGMNFEEVQKHPDAKLSFSSQIDLIPSSLRLNNMKLDFGDRSIAGKITFKDSGDLRLQSKLMLKVNEINANEYGIPKKVDDTLYNLYLYDNDKDGVKIAQYFQDYKWLRAFPMDINAQIIADKAIYKDQTFNKIYASFRVSQNMLNIDEIRINSDLLNLSGQFKFQLDSLKPIYNLNFDIKSIDVFAISRLFPSSDLLAAAKNAELNKEIEAQEKLTGLSAGKTAVVNNEAYNLPLDSLNFYSLQNYNGNFFIKIAEMKNSSLPMESAYIKGVSNEGVIDFENFDFDVFKGRLTSKGTFVIGTSIPNMNFSYALNNFDPRYLIYTILDMNNLSGYMSANGSISTSGLTKDEMLRNISGQANFIGKKIEFNGMDLAEIIRVTEQNEALNLKIEYLKRAGISGKTIFDDVQGVVTFNQGIAELNNIYLSNNRSTFALSSQVDYINKLISSKGKISFIPTGGYNTLTLDIEAQGPTQNTTFNVGMDEIMKYLQLRLGASREANEIEDKSRSLLRNRKL